MNRRKFLQNAGQFTGMGFIWEMLNLKFQISNLKLAIEKYSELCCPSPFLGIASCSPSKRGPRNKVDAITGPTFIARSDKQEYARLKALDLNEPKIIAKQKKMPVGKIGNLSVGRLISGSNLISMNMHARDLDYVRALAANYNTEERIFMTLKQALF